MDYVVEKVGQMKMIGYERSFTYEEAYEAIPKFWNEFCIKCAKRDNKSTEQQVIERCQIGEFAICVADGGDHQRFRYIIGGRYDGGIVPEGMGVIEIPALEWAKFRCIGAMPEALQTVNTKIFKEWLPGNPDYEIATGINIEWYSTGDIQSQTYESGIWIPIRKK